MIDDRSVPAEIGGFGQSSLDCDGVTCFDLSLRMKKPSQALATPGRGISDSRSGFRVPLRADDTLFRRASS
jgi:hypothetical protein